MLIQRQTYKTKAERQNTVAKKYPVLQDNISITTTVHALHVPAVKIAAALRLMVQVFSVLLFLTDMAVAAALRESL